MKKILLFIMMLMILFLSASGSQAATINLYDWAFNVNGTLYESKAGINKFSILPSSFNYAGFDLSSGVGTISIYYNPGISGSYYFASFFDHEVDDVATGNIYFNEYGSVFGSPTSGQSWEIDEPEYYFGNIYSNFKSESLDGSIFNGAFEGPEDVSMAMGWNFSLDQGQWALITLHLSETRPGGEFYLSHIDPDSQTTIYFSGNLQKQGGGAVPEPSTFVLLGSALVGFVLARRKFQAKKQ